ncbi:MAG TPA: SRPBCC family protein [Solirubrobacterales bacterium]|nr:SRPBCC family protein [Solirubrobacterales bacterium]
MGKVNASIEVAAPQDQVWEAISDPAKYEKWLTIHTKWKDGTPEGFTEGAQVAEVVTMLGMANTITWTVEEFDAPSRMRISGTGMAGVRSTFTLAVGSDGDGGSKVDMDAEFEGQMIAGALGVAVEKDAREQLELSLRNFNDLVAG